MIRRDGAVISITPVLDTNAYSSGDVLFVPTSVSEAVLDTKGVSNLRTLVLIDKANQKQAIDLLFFNQDPGSIGAANAALAVTDAQLAAYFIGRVPLAAVDYVTAQSSENAEITKLLEMLIVAAQGKKAIWVAGVCRSGTPTYAVSDIVLKLILERY